MRHVVTVVLIGVSVVLAGCGPSAEETAQKAAQKAAQKVAQEVQAARWGLGLCTKVVEK